MGKPSKSSSRSNQPRESKALHRLQDAMKLDPADWQAFLTHLRDGFADYERANWHDYDKPLELADAPKEWFQDPNPLGYVTLRVLRKAQASLALPVARFFLSICDPGPRAVILPPGIGAAWLHAVKAKVPVPIDAVRMTFLVSQAPKDFFLGVSEDDLPLLSQMFLESRGTPEAWDLHVLLAAVARAGIHVRAPFRLFHALMAAEWLSREVKREFCRGLLGCSPQAERLGERAVALQKMLESGEDWWGKFPLFWMDVAQYGLRAMVAGLQRHAVFALADPVGEPALAVIEEFLLRPDKLGFYVEMVHQGALDVVEASAIELGPEVVWKLLKKAIKGGIAVVRHAAYRIGLKQFGVEFARPALKDPAGSVRKWATKALAQSARAIPVGRGVTDGEAR